MLFHIISTFGHLLDWRSGSYRLVAKLLVHDYISITSMSKCNILTYASTDVSSQDMGTLEHSGRTQERYQPKWSESVHVPSMYIFKYCYMYMHPLLKSIFFDINKTFSRSFKMYTVSQIILVLWVKRLKRAFALKLNFESCLILFQIHDVLSPACRRYHISYYSPVLYDIFADPY